MTRTLALLAILTLLAPAGCDSDGGASGSLTPLGDDAAVGDILAGADAAADAADATTVGEDAGAAGDTASPWGDAAATGDTAAATEDTGAAGDTASPVTCPDDAVTVTLYEDYGVRSTSWYDQPLTDDDVPIVGATVRALSAGGVAHDALDCGGGRYALPDLGAGAHVLRVDVDAESTSNNHGRRLPAAIEEGAVEVLTFGDSIPAYGPTPWFPAQLASILAPLASVDDVNVAVPGSRTVDWLPGTAYWEQRLAPHLGDADVVVFSLGGNDLMDLAFEAQVIGIDDALALLDELDAALVEIESNLETIYATVRAAAPDADVLWLLYPNYAESANWAPYLGEYQDLAATLMDTKLEEVRAHMAGIDGLMIADLLGSLDAAALDAFLWDELHLNVAGHRYYAEEVFITLGGVLVDPTHPRGVERAMGFAP